MAVLVAAVRLCGGDTPYDAAWIRTKLFRGQPGGSPDYVTTQDYVSLLSQGRLTFSPSSVFVLPDVVDVPCSGTGPDGVAWSSMRCAWEDIMAMLDRASSQALRSLGVPASAYSHIVIFLPQINGCPSGQSRGTQTCAPGRPCYVLLNFGERNNFDQPLLMHELGHNMGLYHSQGAGNANEYGDNGCVMGSQAELTCYNAAQSSRLGWALPLANVDGAQLLPGRWLGYTLPALATANVSYVQVSPTWLAGGSLYRGHTLYVSFRAPVGCDVGLRPDLGGRAHVHSYVDTSGNNRGNITLLQGSVDLGALWPAAGARSTGPQSFRLAVRMTSRTPTTDPAPTARVELCRYDSVVESNCNNGIDDDCDGLEDAADPDCQ